MKEKEKNETFFTDEELKEIRKKARRKSIVLTRWLIAIVVLAVLSLSWYGAEMLIYGYSQPSVVKAFVAVCIALGLSGNLQKEMVKNEHKKEFFEGLAKGIAEKCGKGRTGSDTSDG